MQQVFITGMLRSGTTLIQTLLTNHPQMFVAYQPFHQLYVDAKRMFLVESGIDRLLPLDDGSPGDGGERARFLNWLENRRFDQAEVDKLASRATSGKGAGIADMARIEVSPGSFLEVRESLHRTMALRIAGQVDDFVGSKEILCEEYVPALLDAGVRCVLIIRDARGVIASANNGRYRALVGDRYPLMMLIRLWRKSAAYWLKYRHHPLVRAIRYEDLAADPDALLAGVADWLGVDRFADGIARTPLKDHFGRPWSGNSSFGDRRCVDSSSTESWRDLLDPRELRFVTACTKLELDAIGYPGLQGLDSDDIRGFVEDTNGVRATYLVRHAVDDDTRRTEAERLALALGPSPLDPVAASRHFLFPEAYATTNRAGATK